MVGHSRAVAQGELPDLRPDLRGAGEDSHHAAGGLLAAMDGVTVLVGLPEAEGDEAQRRLAVVCPNLQFARIFRLTGIDLSVEVYSNLNDAVIAFDSTTNT